MSDAVRATRIVSVGIFLLASGLAFFGAMLGVEEESYTQGTDPVPLGLTIFGLANAVAAALAACPGRSLFARVAGTLTLVPGYLLIREFASDQGRWLLVGLAGALVVAGGLWGGGILAMIARKAAR